MDSILAEESADGMVWVMTDHQGSVTQVVNEYGGVVEEREFSAFGVGEFVSFSFGYTGREYDAEAGLYYYRNRYYDQEVGKFISSDPIGFEGGDRNLFRYVGNDAVNKSDPSGLFAFDAIKKLFGFGDPARYSKLSPTTPRDNWNDEEQRLKAIQIIKDYKEIICENAKKSNVTPSAIAGAILWEGIENPYPIHRIFRDNIVGKVHPYAGESADLVEREGKVPNLALNDSYYDFLANRRYIERFDPFGLPIAPSDTPEAYLARKREQGLKDPTTAIMYNAVILASSAEKYESLKLRPEVIRGIDIRNQAGLLTSFYQGVDAADTSEKFLGRRNTYGSSSFITQTLIRGLPDGTLKDNLVGLTGAQSLPRLSPIDNSMGSWVSQNRAWIDSFFKDCKWRNSPKC